MKKVAEVHAYLAGPDVFFPDAIAIGQAGKAKLAAVGITGHFPFDNEIPKETFSDPVAARNLIAQKNEEMMLNCCQAGRVGIILVNMTPYHGPSMDVGTGFETGFMSALAHLKKNVIIIGYTDDQRPFEDRVIDDVYGGRQNIATGADGVMRGPDGNMIEAFGGADNLMITHAIEKTGGRVCSSLDEAVALAKELSDKKIVELNGPAKFKKTRSTETEKG